MKVQQIVLKNGIREQLQTLKSGFEKEISKVKRKSWRHICSKEADLYCCQMIVYSCEEYRLKDCNFYQNIFQNKTKSVQ